MRIVVVDDESPILDSCVASLEAAGYLTEGYNRGEPALEAVADEPPDLLLVNWRLPGLMDGIEIARRARRLQPDLRIMMITGDAPSVAGRALGAGVLQVLQKPFSSETLVAAVRAIVGDSPPEGGAVQ